MADNQDMVVRIAARGDGVTAAGQHIAGAAPGDIVSKDGGLIHGPHHIEPICQHFRQCGNCTLQHIDKESYSDFLQDRIKGALAGQNIVDIAINAPIISKEKSRRRTSFRVIRMGKTVHIGFNTGQSHRVVDIKQCEVLHPDIFALFAPLRIFFAEWEDKKLNLIINVTLADQGVDLLIKNINPDSLKQYERLSAFAKEHNLARLTIDRGEGAETLYAPEAVTITLGNVPVALPPDSFLQATKDGENALCNAVKDWLGCAATVADLFSGLGTFALSAVLASGQSKQTPARKIYAAEAGRDAITALKSAANSRNIPIFTEHRDLYRRPLTAAEANRFDAIILDPPRAGAKEQIAQLSASHVAKIIYVSCNPSSFARDCKTLLSAGYVLKHIQPVGQFLWSTHVELAALFENSSHAKPRD